MQRHCRRIPRRFPLFLLLFLVFWGQNAGLMHVIGHGHAAAVRFASRAATADVAPVGAGAIPASAILAGAPGSPDDGAACERCFHFAHVAAAAAPHLPSLLAAPGTPSVVRSGSAPLLASAPPPSRSRGPPAVLL